MKKERSPLSIEGTKDDEVAAIRSSTFFVMTYQSKTWIIISGSHSVAHEAFADVNHLLFDMKGWKGREQHVILLLIIIIVITMMPRLTMPSISHM